MKNLFIYLMVCGSLIYFASCTKAYNANPGSASNNSANPLTPTMSSFDWSGTAPMSAVITNTDGSTTNWVADHVDYQYSGGYNIFFGSQGGKKIIGVWLGSIYPGNKYSMGRNFTEQYFKYSDSSSVPDKYIYWTYNAPNYSGGVYVVKSDTFLLGTHGYLQGQFYGELEDSQGRIVNVSNGYFNFAKW